MDNLGCLLECIFGNFLALVLINSLIVNILDHGKVKGFKMKFMTVIN